MKVGGQLHCTVKLLFLKVSYSTQSCRITTDKRHGSRCSVQNESPNRLPSITTQFPVRFCVGVWKWLVLEVKHCSFVVIKSWMRLLLSPVCRSCIHYLPDELFSVFKTLLSWWSVCLIRSIVEGTQLHCIGPINSRVITARHFRFKRFAQHREACSIVQVLQLVWFWVWP